MAQEPLDDGKVSFKMYDSSNVSQEEVAMLRNHIWQMRHPDAQSREQLWPSKCVPRESDLKGIATQRVYEWESDTTWFRAYEVEVHSFVGFQYILDFSGSTNHEIQGTFGVNDQRVEAGLQPYELETVCLVSRNKLDPFKFAVKMQWVITDVHPSIVETALAMNNTRIKKEWDLMMKAGVTTDDDLNQTREKLHKGKCRYVDIDWYPSADALYIEGDKSPKVAEEQVMWRRSLDFCKNPQVFTGGISPTDVQQGMLGNCWFCCSLSGMAERTELIERLFVTKEVTKDGIFEVFFWHNGIKKIVILDDFFPCKPYSGPIYSKTQEDELWVAILEKAYAQLYGCYERLIKGSPYYALPDLTGNPCEVYNLHDKNHLDGLWEKLYQWNQTEDTLTTAACEEHSHIHPSEAGLMVDHSYTILGAKEALNVRLLQIRNPWGHGEWKGDWSDFSPLWTEKAKTAFGVNDFNPDDGEFWMCYEDFLKYFTNITACYCRRDWSDARIECELKFDHNAKLLTTAAIKLTVPENGIIHWLGIYQQDNREQNAPSYTDLACFVFRESNKGREAVGYLGLETSRQIFSQFGQDSRESFPALKGGIYLLVPFTSGRLWDPDSGSTRKIALSCHVTGVAPNACRMAITKELDKDGIDQVILDTAMVLGEKKMWHDLERRNLRIGQMDLYCGRNTAQDKILTYSMSGELDNIVNAYGYPDLGDGCQFEMAPQQCAIFGVQVSAQPKVVGSSTYKFGIKTRAAE